MDWTEARDGSSYAMGRFAFPRTRRRGGGGGVCFLAAGRGVSRSRRTAAAPRPPQGAGAATDPPARPHRGWEGPLPCGRFGAVEHHHTTRRRGRPTARPRRALLLVLVLGACLAPPPEPDYGRPLPSGSDALVPVAERLTEADLRGQWYARSEILPALDHSITWMDKPSARRHFPAAGVSYERARASLERFRQILMDSRSSTDFARAVDEEFQLYRSAGWDGQGGGVLFTGYCTPIVPGRLQRDGTYRYPLYALPPDLEKGPDGEILGMRTESGELVPYPDRRTIETTGLLAGRGLGLVWLKDPVDVFLSHVNGSTVVRLPGGELRRFGYAGKNGRPYTSLRNELVRDGRISPDEAGLPAIRAWAARATPEEVSRYLRRNASYVFFTPIAGSPRGSLNVPVTARRTLATDKSLFPRGALVFVDARLPEPGSRDTAPLRQFMFDQDTGGAIRTAGRADIYLGQGGEAEELAGTTVAPGQLYYLFLRDATRGGT